MNGGGGTQLLRSGVWPIDECLGGLTVGKPHLLTGPPGSGKTTICLGFLGTVLSDGGSAALLTQDDPRDVVAQAADIGLDLRRAAATGRFSMVCYKSDFAARFGRAEAPDLLVDELVRLVGPGAPDTLAVDSVIPFVETGSASGSGVTALVQALDRLRATALVTYPGDVRDYYDRRLDALVRRCAAITHVSSYGGGVGRMDVVKARARLWSDSPSFFGVRPGHGIVPVDASGPAENRNEATAFRRQILLVQGADRLPQDLVASLVNSFSVSVHEDATVSVPETLAPDIGAVVVPARWDAITDATAFLRQLRRAGNRTPVILVTCGDVRSSDRVRAVLAGFDEVISDATAPSELNARVMAVLRRGRSTTLPLSIDAGDSSVNPSSDGPAVVVEEVRFRVVVEAAANDANGAIFSVLFMSPDDGELDSLVALVARTMRAGSGDRTGIVGERVAVYLPNTRQTEAAAFTRRVCNSWRQSGRRELRVATLACPADRERLRADLRLPAPLPAAMSGL